MEALLEALLEELEALLEELEVSSGRSFSPGWQKTRYTTIIPRSQSRKKGLGGEGNKRRKERIVKVMGE